MVKKNHNSHCHYEQRLVSFTWRDPIHLFVLQLFGIHQNAIKQKQIKTKQFLTDDKFDTLARMRHFHLRHMGLCGRFFCGRQFYFNCN